MTTVNIVPTCEHDPEYPLWREHFMKRTCHIAARSCQCYKETWTFPLQEDPYIPTSILLTKRSLWHCFKALVWTWQHVPIVTSTHHPPPCKGIIESFITGLGPTLRISACFCVSLRIYVYWWHFLRIYVYCCVILCPKLHAIDVWYKVL